MFIFSVAQTEVSIAAGRMTWNVARNAGKGDEAGGRLSWFIVKNVKVKARQWNGNGRSNNSAEQRSWSYARKKS